MGGRGTPRSAVYMTEGETSRTDTPYTGRSALSGGLLPPRPGCSILKEKICHIRHPGTTSHRTLKIHLYLSQENASKKIGTRAVLEIPPPFSDDEIFAGT